MNAEKILEFAKVNGGVAVVIVLGYAYISKLETRLDKVERQLFDCYVTTRQSASSSGNSSNQMRDITTYFAIIPSKDDKENLRKAQSKDI